MNKRKKIDLHGPVCAQGDQVGFPAHYIVRKIVNSTEYDPKQTLYKTTVDKLCVARDWVVTITAGEQIR